MVNNNIKNDILKKIEKIDFTYQLKKNTNNTIEDYKQKIKELIDKGEILYKDIINYKNYKNNGDKIKESINEFTYELGNYEEALCSQNNSDVKQLLIHANQIYRNIQSKYLQNKFENLDDKIEENIKSSEKMVSDIMFNVISIFLGISITTAMVSGVQYIKPDMLLFYFTACAWVALTILVMTTTILKTWSNKSIWIILIYFIYTFIWIAIGLNIFE